MNISLLKPASRLIPDFTRVNLTSINLISTNLLSIGLLIFIIFYSALTQAANITVSSSRNPVAIDDSFHLTYETDSSIDGEPDFSPLYQYFDVLSSSQSTNMRFINGDYSLKKSWDLSVIAKQIGTFTIPSIKFGNDLSPAIQITVHDNPTANNYAPNPSSPKTSPGNQATIPATIFLENSLDKKETWVQSQLIYTIRLLRTVSVIGGSLTEAPETNDSDAIIHKISEDSYQTTRNNIRYDVFERRYAIFPQKSGVLKINPMTFEGRINAKQPQTIFDQFRMSGQLKRLRSKPLEATVNAAPDSINLQDWLPANNVQLLDEWSDDIQQIKTGEPITRTITIIADGLTGIQLPELNIEEINNVKQYPDKAVIENRQSTNSKGITGIKQIKVAMIPAVAGNYTLPEIKLAWWNTTSNQAEVAIIPEQTITAIGSASTTSQTSASTNTPIGASTTSPATTAQTTKAMEQLPAISSQNNNDKNPWPWISLFFAAAWLATLFLLLKKSTPTTVKSHTLSHKKSESIASLISKVKKHAKNNDAKHTKDALINWAQVFFADKTLSNLTQISQHCCVELSDEITQLNKILYSAEHTSWKGDKLLTAFKKQQTHTMHQQNRKNSALKPLYEK